MSRALTPDSSLENLRKEAKRWLKSLRANDAASWSRLREAIPAAPREPVLRDVQFALAREYGFPGWNDLRAALEDLKLARHSLAERVDMVLRAANWQADHALGSRILRRWPEIGSANIFTAVATGNLARAREIIAADPDAAARPGGPLDREPLLYLTYAHLPGGEKNAIEIAGLLLDHGANPNASWLGDWGPPPFMALTGVIGQGEGVQPAHPQAPELAAYLVERGADPFDRQALYNTSITDDDVFWLDFLWEASARRDRLEMWRSATAESGIGGRLVLSPLNYLLGNATANNHLRRAEWLLAHGADANALHSYSERPLREEALIQGYAEMAELLARHGATEPALQGVDAYRAACMRGDKVAVRRLIAENPAFLQEAQPMLAAAQRDQPEIVSMLLDLGVSPDVMDRSDMRPLHAAVSGNSLRIAKMLVEHGADIDRPTKHYGGPMGFCAHAGNIELAAYLAPFSRDVHNLTALGFQGRLAQLFAEDPALVNALHFRGGWPPLFVIPRDEDEAIEMASFLLAHGADPSIRVKGQTAEEAFRKDGFLEVAELLREATAK